MKHFLCELILSCVIATPGAKPVDELTYGTVLYAYYQDDYQQALLETMVAEAQNRRGDDSVRFDLAKGSFAFSDRMYEMARQTFAAVDQRELTEVDRMRLAFHLAREYHRRGDYAGMAAELDKIDVGKTWRGRARHHPEVEYMRAEVDMAGGRLAEAEAKLDKLDDDAPFLAYGLFNLGVSYRAVDRPADARRVFERLAGSRAEDAETTDLVQRAKLALAVIAREQGDVSDATEMLGALPGEGRYRDAALAAYGDLAMDNTDYELAARIWLTLQNQAYWTASTAQARLAFPVSLEGLASRQLALEQYRRAEQTFEERLELLTILYEQAEDPRWVHSLLQAFSAPEQDPDRMVDLAERWRAQLGHTDWLEWLASEETHQVLMEWRELLSMQEWLSLLPMSVGAFEEVAAEQRRRSAAARRLLEDEALLEARHRLQAGIEAQAGVLSQLAAATAERTPAWMFNLATEEERALIAQLERMRWVIDRGMEGRQRHHSPDTERPQGSMAGIRKMELAECRTTSRPVSRLGSDDSTPCYRYREKDRPDEYQRLSGRLDRLEGVIFWQVANDRSVRNRNLVKAHQANVALLRELDERIERVQGAEAQFVAGVETDFMAFADRADSLSADVDMALIRREVALAGELRRGMAREMEEVQKYLIVTRIGIARATDLLAMEPETAEGE